MTKQSDWFKGLLYAEEIGVEETAYLVKHFEFMGVPTNDFENGIVDYYEHAKRLNDLQEQGE